MCGLWPTIRACGASADPLRDAASNLIIENNTCVDCGAGDVAGVRIDPDTSCVVRRNLFPGRAGRMRRVQTSAGAARQGRSRRETGAMLILDNIAAGGCEAMDGVTSGDVAFKNSADDDFTNESGCGASGWMLAPEGFNGLRDAAEEEEGYRQPPLADDADDAEDGEPETPEAEGIDSETVMRLFDNNRS